MQKQIEVIEVDVGLVEATVIDYTALLTMQPAEVLTGGKQE